MQWFPVTAGLSDGGSPLLGNIYLVIFVYEG
jgi:hypothetical protein